MHTGGMADDDIERLLREVNALNASATGSGSTNVPATSSPGIPAKKEASSAGGRLAFALASGAVLGVAGWFGGLLMPFVGSFSAGVGAAFGAFAAALIAGPPRWFSS